MSRGYAAVGLYRPKTRVNVASALRACGCYGVAMLACEGQRYKQHSADTMKAFRRIPFIQAPLKQQVPYDCVPVAVELVDQAVDLRTYKHPQRAFYVFGPEDGTLGRNVLSWCRDVVQIPTNGCMNLAASVNVVLYDRLLKEKLG